MTFVLHVITSQVTLVNPVPQVFQDPTVNEVLLAPTDNKVDEVHKEMLDSTVQLAQKV